MNQLLYTDTHLPGCKQLQMQSILYGIPMVLKQQCLIGFANVNVANVNFMTH